MREFSIMKNEKGELNAAARRTLFELRKTRNDAKRLSPELCSFAHFRVFRSSKHILRPKAAPNTSSWFHRVIRKSKFLYDELNAASRRTLFELRKARNDAKRLSPKLCFFAHFRVFRSSKHILRPKAARSMFSWCQRVIHKSKFLYNRILW